MAFRLSLSLSGSPLTGERESNKQKKVAALGHIIVLIVLTVCTYVVQTDRWGYSIAYVRSAVSIYEKCP